MSTGYGWEGLRQICATLLGARHTLYLSAPAVAKSIWGAVTNVHLYLFFNCTS